MGINIKNNIRKVDAKLGNVTITRYGKTWAVQYGLDGANVINNAVLPVPTDIKEYLEGNDNITIFACASNIDKLCEYALASFPNIEDLYLFKTSAIVVLEDDLSYLLDLNKIYVPTDLLSAYISAYPSLSSKFDTIVEDYTLTIPFSGDTTLTSEWVDSVIAMLSNAEKNAITKVVIPTDFSSESADEIAWGYDFSAIVNLDNNIWYGATQYDFSVWTIEGSGTLTSAIVESSIASIPNDKLSGVSKVVVSNTFTLNTSASAGCLDACDNLPNVNTLELNQEIKSQYDSDSIIYSNFKNDNCKFKNIYYNYSSLPGSCFRGCYIEYFEGLNINILTWYAFEGTRLKDIYVPNVTLVQGYTFDNTNILGPIVLFEKLSSTGADLMAIRSGGTLLEKVFLPEMLTFNFEPFAFRGNLKVFIGTNNCSLLNNQYGFGRGFNGKIFVPAESIAWYMSTYSSIVNYTKYLYGIIDGANVYTNIKNRGVSMGYPKLTGIDTEANIQLLTPSDNALYLASDTGNLWQYSSGAWTNLFNNYQATWYSDENCTTTIQPSDITSDMTIYVKLSAI